MTKLDVVEAEISFRPESDGDAWAPRHLNSTLASSYRLHIVMHEGTKAVGQGRVIRRWVDEFEFGRV